LAALSEEVADEETFRACPADLMPQRMAALTTWLDDNGSLGRWPGLIRR
jgi:hypothetical protein